MTSITGWKVFTSQFDNKLKEEYVIRGEIFPGLAFCLPEEVQNKVTVDQPVSICLPKTKHIDSVLEALQSVVDFDWDKTSSAERFNKPAILFKKNRFENEESTGIFVRNQDPPPVAKAGINSTFYQNTTQKKPNQSPTVIKDPFEKFISFSMEYTGRVNRTPFNIVIEKWDVDNVEEIVSTIYKLARNTTYIPLLHRNSFEIPEMFQERFFLSSQSEVIILRGKSLPTTNQGDVSKWMNIKIK